MAARHGHDLLLAPGWARGARPERNEDGARAPHFAARAGGHARYPSALDRGPRLWRRAAARDGGDDATTPVRVARLVEHPAGRPLDAGGGHLVASGLRCALDRLLRAGAARHTRERRGARPARVGWARLVQDGLFCNALASVGNRPLIVAQSASDIVTYPATGTFTNNVFHAGCAVGQGRFTVEADRAKLGPVMERVLAARKRTAFADGDIFTYRLLHAKASALLAGTGADVAAEGTLDEWMAAMRFETVRDCERGDPDGWTPLIFAVVANRVDLAAALLDRGAKLRQRTRRVDKWQCLMRGFTPQHAAATMCDSPEMMQLLLARGASAPAGDGHDQLPLQRGRRPGGQHGRPARARPRAREDSEHHRRARVRPHGDERQRRRARVAARQPRRRRGRAAGAAQRRQAGRRAVARVHGGHVRRQRRVPARAHPPRHRRHRQSRRQHFFRREVHHVSGALAREPRYGNGDAVRAGHAAARRVVQRDARLRQGAPRGPRRPDVAEASEEDGAAAPRGAQGAQRGRALPHRRRRVADRARRQGQTPAQVAERGRAAGLGRGAEGRGGAGEEVGSRTAAKSPRRAAPLAARRRKCSEPRRRPRRAAPSAFGAGAAAAPAFGAAPAAGAARLRRARSGRALPLPLVRHQLPRPAPGSSARRRQLLRPGSSVRRRRPGAGGRGRPLWRCRPRRRHGLWHSGDTRGWFIRRAGARRARAGGGPFGAPARRRRPAASSAAAPAPAAAAFGATPAATPRRVRPDYSARPRRPPRPRRRPGSSARPLPPGAGGGRPLRRGDAGDARRDSGGGRSLWRWRACARACTGGGRRPLWRGAGSRGALRPGSSRARSAPAPAPAALRAGSSAARRPRRPRRARGTPAATPGAGLFGGAAPPRRPPRRRCRRSLRRRRRSRRRRAAPAAGGLSAAPPPLPPPRPPAGGLFGGTAAPAAPAAAGGLFGAAPAPAAAPPPPVACSAARRRPAAAAAPAAPNAIFTSKPCAPVTALASTSTTAAAAASTAPREVRLNGTFEQLPAEMQGWLSQMEQTIRKWGEYSAGMPSLGELGAADALAKGATRWRRRRAIARRATTSGSATSARSSTRRSASARGQPAVCASERAEAAARRRLFLLRRADPDARRRGGEPPPAARAFGGGAGAVGGPRLRRRQRDERSRERSRRDGGGDGGAAARPAARPERPLRPRGGALTAQPRASTGTAPRSARRSATTPSPRRRRARRRRLT